MLDKNPENWSMAVWVLMSSSGAVAYAIRLHDRIQNKAVKSLVIEILDACICLALAFGIHFAGASLQVPDGWLWLGTIWLAHRGTHFIFSRLDKLAKKYEAR